MKAARLAIAILGLFYSVLGWAVDSRFVITPAARPRFLEVAPDIRVFEDTSAKLNFDAIRALDRAQFVTIEKLGKLNFDSAYWARVDIRSELPLDTQYMVIADWWDYLDYYLVRSDGSVTTQHGGLLKVPTGPDDSFFPKFTFRSGETPTVFARFKSTGLFHTPQSPVFYLWQSTSLLEKMQPFDYFQGIVLGMLVGLAIYNLFIASSTRDRAYFLYCAYLFALSISLVGQMSPDASKLNQFFMPGHPVLAVWLKRLSDPAAWILLLLFNRAFLETRRYLPAWDKFFLALAAFVALEAVLFLAGLDSDAAKPYFWVSEILYHLIAVGGITAGVLRYRQGFVAAKYFVIAQSLLSLGLLARLYQDWFGFSLNFLPNGVFWRYVASDQLWVGAAAEAAIFAMGLAYRMNMLKATVAQQALDAEQERRRTALENNERLEVEVAERTRELRLEKENASQLLHNILPAEVAAELIAKGSTQPRRYEEVSILFTDFKGFSNAVASLPSKKVVEELNDIFQHFDDIIEACGVEKIKTIGDSYMIAGGLPRLLPDHAQRCVDTALKMLAYIDERNKVSAIKWNMRAGIHSGAVVAGVVGKRKFTYDVWGDTVNIASRMESAGEPGKVNVSAYTYDLVRSKYDGTYRGKLDAKGTGEIDMYFVLPHSSTPA